MRHPWMTSLTLAALTAGAVPANAQDGGPVRATAPPPPASSAAAAVAGKPDINMAQIAAGFGVKGEIVNNPLELKAALARGRTSTVEGRPYLIDVQVARRGVGWTDTPWIPPIKGSAMRTRRV